jgi:hypothetical protein
METVFLIIFISYFIFGLIFGIRQYCVAKGEILPFESKLEFFAAFTIMGYFNIALFIAYFFVVVRGKSND